MGPRFLTAGFCWLTGAAWLFGRLGTNGLRAGEGCCCCGSANATAVAAIAVALADPRIPELEVVADGLLDLGLGR